ncbi:MAG TPA: hypothetical protein IAA64_09000 [Candidatus Ornithocaccomicrobium faecavium]|uniref:Uncharacterized protein n=1 Tax=Candidatus Ornithocaccomicrobium faecavium TaxID=2840890 RepID=A0A9D1P7U8_9FIRM|nr:hypothetical protein [Candidatus Ornithocaccomicrobium faecavium]
MKKISILALLLITLSLAVSFGAMGEEVCNHNFGQWNTRVPAGCETPGVQVRICSICGRVEEEAIPAKGHQFGNWNERVSATCTAPGIQVRICGGCGKVEEEAIPQLPHTEEILPGKAATCTEEGLTEGKRCSVCGEILVAQETIPANGHTEETLPGKAATCTEEGLTEGKQCSVCGEILVAQETIPASHVEEILPGKAATCTEEGLTEGKRCSVCGAILVAQETIPPTTGAHTWSAWTLVRAATCEKEGLEQRKCTVCGAVEEKTLPATEHRYTTQPAINPSCAIPGRTAGVYCATCGKVFVVAEQVPALGHNYSVEKHTNYNEYTCERCGNTYRTYHSAAPVEEKPSQNEPSMPSQESVPAKEEVAEEESMGEFQSIVFDEMNDAVPYQVERETILDASGAVQENLLSILPQPNEMGEYKLYQLHISFELLVQWQEEEITLVKFVMGNVELDIPMSLFETENLQWVLEDLQGEAIGYIITLNPQAVDQNGDEGCFVRMDAATQFGAYDITSIVPGLLLRQDGVETAVLASAVYVREDTIA